jgi:hypothetical protein
MISEFVQHHKSGLIYIILHENATDTTNIRDGNEVIVYKYPSTERIFVRDKDEFWTKFHRIDYSDIKHVDRATGNITPHIPIHYRSTEELK